MSSKSHDILLPHVGKVLLGNSGELKRRGLGRQLKRVDAARLAKMATRGIVPTMWVPPQPMR